MRGQVGRPVSKRVVKVTEVLKGLIGEFNVPKLVPFKNKKEETTERNQRIRDNDRYNLLKLLEKQKLELEKKISNLKNSGLLENSALLKDRLINLEGQLSVLNRKLNYTD